VNVEMKDKLQEENDKLRAKIRRIEEFLAYWEVNYDDIRDPENYLLAILDTPEARKKELLNEMYRKNSLIIED
jgi:hypothetical protein